MWTLKCLNFVATCFFSQCSSNHTYTYFKRPIFRDVEIPVHRGRGAKIRESDVLSMCIHISVYIEMSDMFLKWRVKIREDWQQLWCKNIHTKTFESHFQSVCLHEQTDSQTDFHGEDSSQSGSPTLSLPLLPPLPHLLGPGHISPPVLPPNAQHSATLGEASLGIMYFPLSLPGIFWSGASELTLLKGSDGAANSVCLSLSPFMPPNTLPTSPPVFGGHTWQHDGLVLKAMLQQIKLCCNSCFCHH